LTKVVGERRLILPVLWPFFARTFCIRSVTRRCANVPCVCTILYNMLESSCFSCVFVSHIFVLGPARGRRSDAVDVINPYAVGDAGPLDVHRKSLHRFSKRGASFVLHSVDINQVVELKKRPDEAISDKSGPSVLPHEPWQQKIGTR